MIASMESHCLPFRDVPHTSELFSTFLENFERVSPYYAHPPTVPGILDAAREVRLDPETRRGVVEVLREQNARLGAGEDASANLDRLAAGAVAIVTGQQVGLFSGPIYSFYKAVTAIRLAEAVARRGLDAVPVFWLATEDHDLAEVNQSFWRTRSGLTRYEMPEQPENAGKRVGEIVFGQAIESMVEQAIAGLEGPSAGHISNALRESYTPSGTYGSAFGKLLARVLAGRGMIFIDPLDARLHRFVAPIFRRALHEADDLRSALEARSKELELRGFHAQVKIAPGSTVLFFNVEGRRHPLRAQNGRFIGGDAEFSVDEISAAIESTPELITPSVLLRPVVQDALLPTVAYVGGPAEVAYMAQAQVVYRKILGRMPAILPRSSFTLVEPPVARILSKYSLDFRDVLRGPQHVRSMMEQRAIPNALARRFETDEEQLRAMLKSYAGTIEKLDATLLGTLEAVEEKMLHQFTKLKEKVGRAENFRTGLLDAHQTAIFESLYPNHELQERTLSALPFLAAYGTELLDELARLSSISDSAEAQPCLDQHHVLFL
ncbi:MAG TPA: bacillithiol biosynthesis cysteine-adding enzyme BshC [Candidatus Acidoferrum sp.]|nr:bacillithiol biosynthesis cysteine-adding enzyme BshC [Candidatus Acidoferrum sp.]